MKISGDAVFIFLPEFQLHRKKLLESATAKTLQLVLKESTSDMSKCWGGHKKNGTSLK